MSLLARLVHSAGPLIYVSFALTTLGLMVALRLSRQTIDRDDVRLPQWLVMPGLIVFSGELGVVHTLNLVLMLLLGVSLGSTAGLASRGVAAAPVVDYLSLLMAVAVLEGTAVMLVLSHLRTLPTRLRGRPWMAPLLWLGGGTLLSAALAPRLVVGGAAGSALLLGRVPGLPQLVLAFHGLLLALVALGCRRIPGLLRRQAMTRLVVSLCVLAASLCIGLALAQEGRIVAYQGLIGDLAGPTADTAWQRVVRGLELRRDALAFGGIALTVSLAAAIGLLWPVRGWLRDAPGRLRFAQIGILLAGLGVMRVVQRDFAADLLTYTWLAEDITQLHDQLGELPGHPGGAPGLDPFRADCLVEAGDPGEGFIARARRVALPAMALPPDRRPRCPREPARLDAPLSRGDRVLIAARPDFSARTLTARRWFDWSGPLWLLSYDGPEYGFALPPELADAPLEAEQLFRNRHYAAVPFSWVRVAGSGRRSESSDPVRRALSRIPPAAQGLLARAVLAIDSEEGTLVGVPGFWQRVDDPADMGAAFRAASPHPNARLVMMPGPSWTTQDLVDLCRSVTDPRLPSDDRCVLLSTRS